MTNYISTKETAVLMRKALKRALPGHKFSVRTQSYSMGSHVDISWDDGPTQKQVEDVVGCFYGSGFDGMCDSSYSVSYWLMPDGSVRFAHSSGTGSMAPQENPQPHPDARLVDFGGSRPSLSRHVSAAFYANVKACFAALGEDERSVLIKKTDALRCVMPYEHPQSWRYDADLSDFGDSAERIFNRLAWGIGI